MFKLGRYYHTTNKENLTKILDSGKLAPLANLAQQQPDLTVNVESGSTSFHNRENLSAAEAFGKMKNKDTYRVFFTKDGYLPNYGDYVIGKSGIKAKENNAINLMPNEYTHDREVKITDKRTPIYVPDEELAEWKRKYPTKTFRPRSSLPKSLSRMQGLLQLPKKLMGTLSSLLAKKETPTKQVNKDSLAWKLQNNASFRRKLFGRNSMLGGSEALGIASTTGGSDTDIFIPYKHKANFDKAVARIKKMFPEIVDSPYNKGKIDKHVMTIKHNGENIDIALSYGDRGIKFRDAFLRAKQQLTDDERKKIVAEKDRLLNSWLFGKLRYKRYKNQVATDLGLRQHYF